MADDNRGHRLAQALRANLHRRKAQTRAVGDAADGDPADGPVIFAASDDRPVFTTADVVRLIHIATFGIEPGTPSAEIVDGVGGDVERAVDHARSMNGFAEMLRSRAGRSVDDHSQNGEFAMIVRHLLAGGTRRRLVVDVGAHGLEGSNSFDLMARHGWRGLLIEANPALLDGIRDAFAGLDHVLVGCAVGTEPGEGVLHLGIGDEVSSLDRAKAENWGPTRGTVAVTVRRLADILDEHGVATDFDLLSLDIEGLDAAVFADLIATSRYRPRLVLIESAAALVAQTAADIGLTGPAADSYRIVDRIACNLLLAPV